MSGSLPALERKTVEFLLIMHVARSAFIQAETLEKIRRDLRHQVRQIGRNYDQGELIYF